MNATNWYLDLDATARGVAEGRHREVVGGLWEQIGRLQFEFLRANGLVPAARLIDIGCGCLRGGVYFVEFLDPGNYFGLDISADLLRAGYDVELASRDLCHRLRREDLICDAEFNFSRFAVKFDMAVAQSLFTHLPTNSIQFCLARLTPQMRTGGRLFATFFVVPDDHPVGMPFTHPRGARTFDHRDPYHYRPRQLRTVCDGLPWRPELVGEWGHPRDQQMVLFHAVPSP